MAAMADEDVDKEQKVEIENNITFEPDFKTELNHVFGSYQSEMIHQSFTEWYLRSGRRRGAWPACHPFPQPQSQNFVQISSKRSYDLIIGPENNLTQQHCDSFSILINFRLLFCPTWKRILSVLAALFWSSQESSENPGESAFRIISSNATAPTWCWSHPRPALTTPPEGALASR